MQQTGQITKTARPGESPQPELSNGNGRKLSRLHLQKQLQPFGIVLNIFADTAAELWSLYNEILALIDDEVASAYTRAVRASARPAAVAPQPRPAPRQSRGNGGFAGKPVCQQCGTDESMELISWKDKSTGELKKAWKCQSCEKWAR